MKITRSNMKLNENTTVQHKFGTPEWAANEYRRGNIEHLKKLTNLDEDVEITEEIIDKNKYMFRKACVDRGLSEERLRAELLGQKYTGLEED